MRKYLDLLSDVLMNGEHKTDRTGTGTISVFGRSMRFDLSQGFPLLTTKKLNLKAIIYELLWMTQGRTDLKYLQDNGVHIWDNWAKEDGTIGRGYGYQFRRPLPPPSPKNWYERLGRALGFLPSHGSDQLQGVIESIRSNPDSRRHIISLWQVDDLESMALPPCHGLVIQFYVRNGKLDCQMYQRSCDLLLGCSFNIAFYSLLTMMIAQLTGLEPGEFIHIIGDAHIYSNHIEQVELQLTRDPRRLPTMTIVRKAKNIDDFRYEDFRLSGYDPHPHIKAPVAV